MAQLWRFDLQKLKIITLKTVPIKDLLFFLNTKQSHIYQFNSQTVKQLKWASRRGGKERRVREKDPQREKNEELTTIWNTTKINRWYVYVVLDISDIWYILCKKAFQRLYQLRVELGIYTPIKANGREKRNGEREMMNLNTWSAKSTAWHTWILKYTCMSNWIAQFHIEHKKTSTLTPTPSTLSTTIRLLLLIPLLFASKADSSSR